MENNNKQTEFKITKAEKVVLRDDVAKSLSWEEERQKMDDTKNIVGETRHSEW